MTITAEHLSSSVPQTGRIPQDDPVTISHGRRAQTRWSRRLEELTALEVDIESEDPLDPDATRRLRDMLQFLDSEGVDTEGLLIFGNHDGGYEVRRSVGTRSLSIDVSATEYEFYDVDLAAGKASSYVATTWKAAVSALITLAP